MLSSTFIALATLSAPGRPTLHFANPATEALLAPAFDSALVNLLDINTVPYDDALYNKTGLLTGDKFLRAGGGYHQPWTRDAAINSWNAASLFEPDIARNTLWAVTVPDQHGDQIVQRDNQWWDKVIWIVGAWNHYQITGDRVFLAEAYKTSSNLLREMRATRFNEKYHLFQGPSFFNDGIAGYPAPPAEKDDKGSSFVLDHPGTDRLMALSTNCLYVGAYQALTAMSKELRKSTREWSGYARDLKSAINYKFWMPDTKTYAYLLMEDGKLDPSQEGCGIAFAALFGVADAKRSQQILRAAHIEPYGITDVYPPFPRFSKEKPGRHNNIVWPMVQGMWAKAAAQVRDADALKQQTELLAKLARGSNNRFFEIYDANTGKADGGWQNGHEWGSEPDQTWSATAYVNMITNGLFGLRFEPAGIRVQPLVPEGWSNATLADVPYRHARLTFALTGQGSGAANIRLDGKRVTFIPSTLVGTHRIEIHVGR